jgi:GNAT superfamily N-acetyltransferase
MSIIIRPLQQTDVHFIHDSWRKSLWKNEVDQDAVPWDAHFEGLEALWKLIDQLPGTRYTVAEFKDVPGEIIGYAVHLSPNRCLWVYVKSHYRRQHIASALLQNATSLGTITRTGKALAKSLGITHDPWMVFKPAAPHQER